MKDGKEFDILNSFEPNNKEIDSLHLAFSKLSRTVKAARTSLNQGNENNALLTYHEVAEIF